MKKVLILFLALLGTFSLVVLQLNDVNASQTVSGNVDINSIDLVNDTYDVIEWEYDFNNLSHSSFYVSSDYSSYNVYEHFLPFISAPGVANYYYKTQIVKYDESLYSEVSFLLTMYTNELKDEANKQENAMQTSMIDAVMTGANSDAVDYAGHLAQAVINNDPDTFNDWAIDYLIEAYQEDTCEMFEEDLGAMGGSMCNLFIDSYLDGYFDAIPTVQELRDAAGEFLMANLGAIISEAAQELAFTVIYTALKQIPGLNILIRIFEVLKSLREALIAYDKMEYCNQVMDGIGAVAALFSLDQDNFGNNVRLDYVVDNYLYRRIDDEDINSISAIKENVEDALVSIVFSSTNTDVLIKSPFGYYWNQGEFIHDADGNTLPTRFFLSSGILKKLTKDEFLSDFSDALQFNSNSSPIELVASNYVYRSFQTYNSEKTYIAPSVELNYASRTDSSLTFSVNLEDYSQDSFDFLGIKLEVYDSAGNVTVLEKDYSSYITIDGLDENEEYKIVAYAQYTSDFGSGTFNKLSDEVVAETARPAPKAKISVKNKSTSSVTFNIDINDFETTMYNFYKVRVKVYDTYGNYIKEVSVYSSSSTITIIGLDDNTRYKFKTYTEYYISAYNDYESVYSDTDYVTTLLPSGGTGITDPNPGPGFVFEPF